MAILTKNEKYIVEMYVRYFGKAPSVAEIAKYNEFGEPKLILTEIIGDADDSNAGLTTEEFVNNAFQNLFGRDATTKEMNKYSKVVDKGEDLPINAIVKAAKKSDKGVYEAKKAIAIKLAEKDNATIYNNLDKITKDTYAKVYDLKAKKLSVDSVAQLETKIDAMKDNVAGKTFNLTTTVDTLLGSDSSDLFTGLVDVGTPTNSTLTALDSIDGGAGKDTLNVLATAALTIPTGLEVKNVETVNLKAGTTIVADTTTWTGTNTLNVTKATTATVTAAATTDVNVSGATDDITVKGGNDITITDNTAASSITVSNGVGTTGHATGTITITDTKFGVGQKIDVDGGTDVTVTATADKVAAGKITVGANKAATGDVKIVSNTTSDATVATFNAGDVTVTGGKTVEITANMTNTAVKAGATTNIITAGKYEVIAGNTTTDVTITQNATATDFANDAAAGTAEVSTVTFGSLKAGEKAIISAGTLTGAGTDLTFTASKDLSAAQVAAAFANLTDKDTQSATGITANGYFSGTLDTGWTSGAVSGSSVTFTATTVGNQASEITVSAKKANGTTDTDNLADFKIASKTDGTAAGTPTGVVVAEDFGDVAVKDNATASITTITLDGFDNATLGAAGGSLNKLATLNLTNGQGSVAGTVLTSTVATLTVNVDDMAGNVDLATNATNLKTLNLKTTGEASTITLNAANVETLTIAAAADLDIATGSTLTALKTATITGAGNVDLGVISAATGLVSFNASANTGGVTATVLSAAASLNADGYVFSAGNDDVTLSASTVSTKVTLGAGDDIVTLAAGTTALAAVIDGGTGSDTLKMIVADAAGVTTLADGAFENKISGFEKLSLTVTAANNAVDLSEFDDISYVISAGTAATGTLGLSKMANNGTLELTGALLSAVTVTMKDATASTDTFNIVTKVDAAPIASTGAVVVAGVETINVTATDISPVDTVETSPTFGEATISQATLILTAADAKTVNVTGNSDIDLSTGTATAHANLKTVDASAMTGALKYTIKSSVADFALTSGSGADIITVDASNNAQVKTGAGADTIIVKAGAVSANIWGGAGNDVFDVTDAISSATQYVTIEDATSGDQIILDTTHFLSGSVSITDFDQMTLTDKFNAVLGDTGLNVDRGADDSFAISFQHAGNTYIVVSDGTAVSSFGAAGTDQVIKLTGLKDLSAGASFNVDGTLEIA